jgi:glutathione S-transferase
VKKKKLQNRSQLIKGIITWIMVSRKYNHPISFIFFLLFSQNLIVLGLFQPIMNMFGKGAAAPAGAAAKSIILSSNYPSWDALTGLSKATHTGQRMDAEEVLRIAGEGESHQDAKIRLFGSKGTPRVTYYRDTAAWCPYCQKVWILLEEKKIPYIVEKIAMRSYGDKPASYLKLVPSGLLPAMNIDGEFMTDSLNIMMTLDSTFKGPNHRPMWPQQGSKDAARAQSLMRLERDLFSRWCNLVFRGSMGNGPIKSFEDGLDKVNEELSVTSSPWFLDEMTIVDLTYITHIERMCASVAYWSGRQIRGDRWPAIERWMTAFEALPSYMATKSDYYTHVTGKKTIIHTLCQQKVRLDNQNHGSEFSDS